MQGQDMFKKVALFIALFIMVAHPLEALLARRMAKKRGKSPALYFFLTLLIGFPIMLRLRKVEKLAPAAEAA